MQRPEVDHLTQESPCHSCIFCVSARSRPTQDVRMLALIAIMTVGIELRDANATPTTIAVSDVNMTDASANAILEYDTVAHIFKQARQLLTSSPM